MQKQKRVALLSAFMVLAIVFVVFAAPKPAPTVSYECFDRIDNDGDGKVDYSADLGCSSKKDTDESNCGDSVCEGTETCSSCVADCGPCPTTTTTVAPTTTFLNVTTTVLPTTTVAPTTTTLPANSCDDTDGGFDLFVPGVVHGVSGGIGYNYSDFCASSDWIVEYYCEGSYWVTYNGTCLTNVTTQCLDSACV